MTVFLTEQAFRLLYGRSHQTKRIYGYTVTFINERTVLLGLSQSTINHPALS